MSVVFIDSGALLARYHETDQYHEEGMRLWSKLQKERRICITSNFVLNETFTLLARRAGYRFTAERARAVYLSEKLTNLRTTQDDEVEALNFFEKYADQDIGFTDCLSFVLMRKRHVQTVFSFDRHFTLAGFQLWS